MTGYLLTTNVGGAFLGASHREGMTTWAMTALKRQPVAVFAQEVPDTAWLSIWTDAGYQPFLGPDKRWKTRSALLIRRGIDAQTHRFPTCDYHGSYLAAARVTLAKDSHVVLCSVHASPNVAEPERYGWPADFPVDPRDGGGDPRYKGRVLWDSDLVLATLGRMAQEGPLIAGGDLNEALAYDLDPRTGREGTWAKEYFKRAAALGLTDALAGSWGEERPTRRQLQLDRCLVNQGGRALLGSTSPRTGSGLGPAQRNAL